MSEPVSEVVASYHRCRASEQFFDTFYEIFLAKSPEIPPKFARTDFTRQKRMLKESLLSLLNYSCGSEIARQDLVALAGRHRELEIAPHLYELWLEALCESVARHDPEYRSETEAIWRHALQPGIALMLNEPDE